jgi:hypothetical protein
VDTGFPKRSCSNKKINDEHDSTQLKHALVLVRPGARDDFGGALVEQIEPDGAAAKEGSELAAAGSESILDRWLSARPI